MENPCKNCKRNCCGKRFKGLSKALKNEHRDIKDFAQILLSKEEVEKIVSSGNIEYIKLVGDNYFLRLNKDLSCKAFKNGRCAIYDVRPNVCRLYPYYFDYFAGVCVDKNCPGKFELNDFETNEKVYNLIEKRLKLFKKIDIHNKEKENTL